MGICLCWRNPRLRIPTTTSWILSAQTKLSTRKTRPTPINSARWSSFQGTQTSRRLRKLFKFKSLKRVQDRLRMISRRTFRTKECLTRGVIWISSKSTLSLTRCPTHLSKTLSSCTTNWPSWKVTLTRNPKVHPQRLRPRRKSISQNRKLLWRTLGRLPRTWDLSKIWWWA